jgi:RNA polymerase-binding transcription factor DksA
MRDTYNYEGARETFTDGSVSLGELESILAFKSDPVLDESLRILERMATGEYGQCIACKRGIDAEMLRHDPARRMCATCEHHAATHTLFDTIRQSRVIL